MKILIVVGTRPQVIKLASLVKALDKCNLEYGLVHTGQHYDFEMNSRLFDELKLPEPLVNLEIRGGLHGWQTGNMIIKLEETYLRLRPSLIIVPGDTNSALAGGLAAVKLGICVAHVEAGLRCGMPFMAEEINRTLLDHLARLLFAPTKTAYHNLLQEGVNKKMICISGDVMADNIVLFKRRLQNVVLPLGLVRKNYIYVTIHRSENVEDSTRLKTIVQILTSIPKLHDLEVVFPVHPHTQRRLKDMGLYDKLDASNKIHLLKPVGYFESLKLVMEAFSVLTDSGGLQKESFILQTPAITLRKSTEWVETVRYGWNLLADLDIRKISKGIESFSDLKPKLASPLKLYGNGEAATKIVHRIKEYLLQEASERK